MTKPIITSGEKKFIDGYFDDPYSAGPNHLTAPSKNMDILKTGEAMYSKGFLDTEIDLNNALKGARPFHVERYNVTFFSINGKILFVDHNNSDAVVDTGVTLTDTNGRNTRFGEYAGDIYFTNTTDGLHQIHMGRVNGAATASATTLTLDQDFVGRLLAFGDTTGTFRIANSTPFTEAYALTTSGNVSNAADNGSGLIRITTSAAHTLETGCTVIIASVGGTTEANGTWVITKVDSTNFDLQGSTFSNAYTSGGTWSYSPTGVFPLSTSLDSNVADNTIIYTVEDISSGRPKGSGLTFWKERMIIWGVVSDVDVDSATNLVYMSKFASLINLENIIDFDVAGTAAKEMVGKGGVVTNVLSTRDYVYMFTENATYFASVSDVNTTTGGTPPQLLTNEYGCINADCAMHMGGGVSCFLTNNKRIMGIRISTPQGAPVVFADEQFDSALSKTLPLLDVDQSDAFMFYAPNDHKGYIHCNIDTERVVFKYNTEIKKWEPPRTGWSFGGMYVKDGVTYATELTDDNIWQLHEGFEDDGADYEKVAATAIVEAEDGRRTLALESIGISGRGSSLATITLENYVGGGTPQQKSFTVPEGSSSGSSGSVTLGSDVLGVGNGPEIGEYDEFFGIYPKYGQSYQAVVRSTGAFTLSSYTVYGSALQRPLLTLK